MSWRSDMPPKEVYESVSLETEPSTNGHRPHTFTAAELMAKELPEVKWVIPDILPEGVTILAGKPKLGKSWLGLGVCVAVAFGGVALGTKRVDKGEGFYLALEDNERRLQQRLRKVLQGRNAPEGLHYCTEWPRMGEGGVEALDGWLDRHEDVRIAVIDTLARIKPRATGRRSQYDEDRDSVDPLVPLAAKHSVAILLVHHLRETESDDPLDMIHGSAGLTGSVDNALVLKRQRGRADAYLHVEGRDIETPTELALKWDANVASWCIVGDAEEYRVNQLRAEVVRVLSDADEPMTPTEVADALGKSANTVKQRMWQMSRDGQIASDSGRYTVVHNPHNRITDEDEEGRVGYGVTPVMDDGERRARPTDPLAHRETDKARVFMGEDS